MIVFIYGLNFPFIILSCVLDEKFVEIPLFQETPPPPKNSWLCPCCTFVHYICVRRIVPKKRVFFDKDIEDNAFNLKRFVYVIIILFLIWSI